jgi:hypothetical protein
MIAVTIAPKPKAVIGAVIFIIRSKLSVKDNERIEILVRFYKSFRTSREAFKRRLLWSLKFNDFLSINRLLLWSKKIFSTNSRGVACL